MILLKYFSHNTVTSFILSSLFIIIYSYACNLYIQFIDIVILITKMLNCMRGTKELKLLRSFNKHYSNIYC